MSDAGNDVASAVGLFDVSPTDGWGPWGEPAHWLSAFASPSYTDRAAPPVTFSGVQGPFRAEGNASLVIPALETTKFLMFFDTCQNLRFSKDRLVQTQWTRYS